MMFLSLNLFAWLIYLDELHIDVILTLPHPFSKEICMSVTRIRDNTDITTTRVALDFFFA